MTSLLLLHLLYLLIPQTSLICFPVFLTREKFLVLWRKSKYLPQDYSLFLSCVCPALLSLLSKQHPQFNSNKYVARVVNKYRERERQREDTKRDTNEKKKKDGRKLTDTEWDGRQIPKSKVEMKKKIKKKIMMLGQVMSRVRTTTTFSFNTSLNTWGTRLHCLVTRLGIRWTWCEKKWWRQGLLDTKFRTRD